MFQKPIAEIFPNPPEGLDPSALVEEAVPQHLAVIMDGNGRWAQRQGKHRLQGHKAGIGAVRETIRAANDCGVRYLTIYSFSTENWKRSPEEVVGLMDLFAKTMLAEVDALDEENVRVTTIGRTEALPAKTRAAFAQAWEQTRTNTGMTLVVAVNYGSRVEMLDAVNSLIAEDRLRAQSGAAPVTVDEEQFSHHLYTADFPDPDLLIRTSGEMRLSNYLLWQIAYAELYCTETLWPDFDRYELLRALLDYQSRERRFGGVK